MTDSLLSFKSVNHAFAEKQVLNNINFELQPGMVVGLLGRNGAGKTTLLRTAVGLLSQTEGEVCLFGEANTALSIANKQRLDAVCWRWIMPCSPHQTSKLLLQFVKEDLPQCVIRWFFRHRYARASPQPCQVGVQS